MEMFIQSIKYMRKLYPEGLVMKNEVKNTSKNERSR